MSKNRIPLAAAALCVAGAVLTGCTSTGPGAASGAPSGAKSGATGSTTASPSAGPVLSPASTIPAASGNKPNLIKQVAQTSCAATTGGWKVAGTVHNTSGSARTYKILTYFTTPKATVIDSASTSVAAKAGKTVPWSASKKFKTERGMRCVVVKVT